MISCYGYAQVLYTKSPQKQKISENQEEIKLALVGSAESNVVNSHRNENVIDRLRNAKPRADHLEDK